MECAGKIKDALRTTDGHIVVTLEIEQIASDEALDKLIRADRLSVTMDKYKEKRTLNANAYLWQLIDKIAKKIGSDKWTQYLIAIYKYGCFFDVSVIDRAIPMLEDTYRYVEILERGFMNGENASVVRCYRGSSTYSKDEMADLINGVVEDALDLGIDVLPPDEIKHLISLWEAQNGRY